MLRVRGASERRAWRTGRRRSAPAARRSPAPERASRRSGRRLPRWRAHRSPAEELRLDLLEADTSRRPSSRRGPAPRECDADRRARRPRPQWPRRRVELDRRSAKPVAGYAPAHRSVAARPIRRNEQGRHPECAASRSRRRRARAAGVERPPAIATADPEHRADHEGRGHGNRTVGLADVVDDPRCHTSIAEAGAVWVAQMRRIESTARLRDHDDGPAAARPRSSRRPRPSAGRGRSATDPAIDAPPTSVAGSVERWRSDRAPIATSGAPAATPCACQQRLGCRSSGAGRPIRIGRSSGSRIATT